MGVAGPARRQDCAAPVEKGEAGHVRLDGAESAPDLGSSARPLRRVDPEGDRTRVVHLVFWFDCEDYTSPYEPTCLARLTGMFARRGLPATWKLVGEEVRMLRRAAAGRAADRNASDAQAALTIMARQSIGFHTDQHSLHPTVAEYCAGAGWEDGQVRVAATEAAGLAALAAAFPGKPISCYGQPGASWAPQVYPLLRRWGIPLYMDEAAHIGLDERPFFYCGVLNVLRLRQFCLRQRGHRPPEEGAVQAVADLERVIRALAPDSGLAQCWWHPNELYTNAWWDGLNFGAGVNRVAPRPDGDTAYHVPPMVEAAILEARFQSLASFLDVVASRRDIHVCSAEEILAAYPDQALGHAFDPSELRRIAESLAAEVTYIRMDNITLSAAEGAYLLARALAAGAEGQPPALPGPIDGPSRRVQGAHPAGATLDALRAAARAFADHVEATGHVPPLLELDGGTLGPATLARAFARAFLARRDWVALETVQLSAETHVSEQGVWDWSIFPPGFSAPDLIELGRLQAWSLKPALARW